MATRYDITADQGSYWSLEITYKDNNGDPIDLTGYTAGMQLREDPTVVGDPDLEITDGDGITLGGADGTILLEITATQSGDLAIASTGETYAYALELTPGDVAHTKRILEGKFSFSREVTR